MEERHENSLNDLLEQIAFGGYASIPKKRILHWYGADAFTLGIRNDLRVRWKTLIKNHDWLSDSVLQIADIDGDVVLIPNKYFYDDNK